jgi:hypothetical protein
MEGAGITDWSSLLWTSDIQQFDCDARWTDEKPEACGSSASTCFGRLRIG